jgi:HD-GYP domain-containing protein (c-di-GMP phosphodiesterase class II)
MGKDAFYQEMGRVITQFTAAVQNTGMYPDDHPQVLSHIREAHSLLEELLKKKREVTILLIGKNLMVDNRNLVMASTHEAAFIRILKRRAIERMSFIDGLPFNQLEELIRDLASLSISPLHSTRYIKLGKLEFKDQEESIVDLSGEDTNSTVDLGTKPPEERIREIYENTLKYKSIDMDMVDELVLHFMNSIRKETSPLKLLSEIKSNDEYTFIHTANVGIMTMLMAESIGFKGFFLNDIGIAAILHDVGKISTPKNILSKQGSLTPGEWSLMEQHTIKGAMYLMEVKGIKNLAILAAMEHHIKFDGTGYPRIQGEWKTNITSQMISIADVFDALRTMRPYRGPMPQHKIEEILKKESGTTFNPFLVRQFLKLISR